MDKKSKVLWKTWRRETSDRNYGSNTDGDKED